MREIREKLNEFFRKWTCPSSLERGNSPWMFSKFRSIGFIVPIWDCAKDRSPYGYPEPCITSWD